MGGARKGLLIAALVMAVGVASTARAQVFVYPKNGQSAEQVGQDRLECQAWATKTTGVDPTQPAQVFHPENQPSSGGILRGHALGLGVDLATHTPWGMVGEAVLKRRKVEAEYERQQQEINNHYMALNQFDRALSACLKGRGYAVE